MTNLNQNGRSMIEMLGVLAIIGVLSVGGIAGYSKAMMKFKINKTIDQIAMTVTNIRTLYAQQVNYDGIATNNAYKMGVVDDAMKATSTTLKNPFSGSVYIGYGKSGTKGEVNERGAFLVAFDGLPREACVAIATNDWGPNYSSGLLGVKVGAADLNGVTDFACYVAGGTATTTANANGLSCAANNEGPLSVASAAAGCSCTGNTCSVTMKYY